jgi:hypothetical protein
VSLAFSFKGKCHWLFGIFVESPALLLGIAMEKKKYRYV